MQFSLASTLLLAATLRNGADALSLRGTSSQRHLTLAEEDYGFVVSQIRQDQDWCLTAPAGANNNGKLRLKPCDFEGAPSDQLWNLDANGKLHTRLDETKCMVANFGDSLFDGVRMRLNDCNLVTNLNAFSLDEGLTDYLTLDADPSYCITNRGPNPHSTDTIHAKPCKNRGDFKWSFQVPETEVCSLTLGGGCLEPKDGATAPGTQLKLSSCDPTRGWRIERRDGAAMLHSLLDDSKCMQAGGSSGGTVVDGTKMKLAVCDYDSDLQKFDWTDIPRLQLLTEPDFCVTYRGLTASIGVDPIIMIECNENRDIEWTCIEPTPVPTMAPTDGPTPVPTMAPTDGSCVYYSEVMTLPADGAVLTFSFAGLPMALPGTDVTVHTFARGDINFVSEFYDIITEDGAVIGTNGGNNDQCGTTFNQVDASISADTFNGFLADDGILEIRMDASIEVNTFCEFNEVYVGITVLGVGAGNCPTYAPSQSPSLLPSTLPSVTPSVEPSISVEPSGVPSTSPAPSLMPSSMPSGVPSISPAPSAEPCVVYSEVMTLPGDGAVLTFSFAGLPVALPGTDVTVHTFARGDINSGNEFYDIITEDGIVLGTNGGNNDQCGTTFNQVDVTVSAAAFTGFLTDDGILEIRMDASSGVNTFCEFNEAYVGITVPGVGAGNCPTNAPSQSPSLLPSTLPSVSVAPSQSPTMLPSTLPSMTPSVEPSISVEPSGVPSTSPAPSLMPSSVPSGVPTITAAPSAEPCVVYSAVMTLPADGAVLTFSFASLPMALPGTDVTVHTFARGDINSGSEFYDIITEDGIVLGTNGANNDQCGTTFNQVDVTISVAAFNGFLVDGILEIRMDASSGVNTFCEFNEAYVGITVPGAGAGNCPSSP